MADIQPTRQLTALFAGLRHELPPAAVRERVSDIVLDTLTDTLTGDGKRTAAGV